jgi:hypothetical protein
MILLEEDFLNHDHCDFLKQLISKTKDNYNPFRGMGVKEIKELYPEISIKLGFLFSNFLATRSVIAYPETLEFAFWPTNSERSLHHDDARGSTTLTSITYLNDDYEGGETFFENGVVVKPKKGKTAFFDGNKYYHGVKPITKGERYVLAIWYSNDINALNVI